MTLGDKLYALRKKNSLSQEQLAEMLNVSRQSISKWEGNVTCPEPDKLIALSDYFQVSLDYLMKADIVDEIEPIDDFDKDFTEIADAALEQGPERTMESEKNVESKKLVESENPNSAETDSKRQSPFLASLTICLAAVIGLLFLGLLVLLAPGTAEQAGASSVIELNGIALLVLFFLGLLILGVALIIRIIRRKS